jgi:hypothetical protein
MDKEPLYKNGPLAMFVGDSNSRLKANKLLTWVVSNYSWIKLKTKFQIIKWLIMPSG